MFHPVNITPVHISVASVGLTHHLIEDVIEVEPAGQVWQQYTIALFDSMPVNTMHVVHIEVITEDAECIIINLVPLLAWVDFHGEVIQTKDALIALLCRLVFGNSIVIAHAINKRFAIGSEDAAGSAIEDLFCFLLFDVVAHDLIGLAVKESLVHGADDAVTAGFHGQHLDSAFDIAEVNFDLYLFRSFFVVILFPVLFLPLSERFTVLLVGGEGGAVIAKR